VPQPRTQLPGTRLAAGGGLLMGLSGVALLISTPFTISAATCDDSCGQHDVSLWPMMVASGAVFAGGTAMLVIGLNERAAARRGEVAVTVGPGHATLSGRF